MPLRTLYLTFFNTSVMSLTVQFSFEKVHVRKRNINLTKIASHSSKIVIFYTWGKSGKDQRGPGYLVSPIVLSPHVVR